MFESSPLQLRLAPHSVNGSSRDLDVEDHRSFIAVSYHALCGRYILGGIST